MRKNDLSQKYSQAVIAIHWISVILILVLFPLGKYMSGLDPEEKLWLIIIHGILGVLIFILTIIRSVLFFTTKRPEHLSTGSKFNDLIAITVQRSFYVLLLIIGVSGLASLLSGGYIKATTATPMLPELIRPRSEIVPLKIHNTLSVLMMFLAAMHIAGVVRFNIKHKTNVIKRIT
ncbi:MAG: cytochrome b/b6 domain-containing protein [Reichenbachiella sp.]|uniref:cytochrome b/b6 domain-containing protein n=1 Tax=Reichenbachiella sp. TaxID=2184521 RepID=UPI0032650470